MRSRAIKATTNWLKFGVLATIGLIFALVAQSAITVPATAAAPVACADAGTTQSSITVTPSHGKVFYIDSGQGQSIDAAYVGYKVVAGAAKTNLWMKLDTFTGGAVSLANAADASNQLGDIANAGSETGFFLLKAATSSSSAQSHVVRVFTGNPSLAGATEIFSCTFTFLKVKETIKAAANKISSNFPTVTNSGIVGGNLVVTVEGATGTIGSGTSSPDGKSIWFSPAAKSSWPTSSLRLTTTSVSVYDNPSMGANQIIFGGPLIDNLRITTAQLTGEASKLYYRAVYTFKIIGRSATPASVIPIAQISSGTQIKHTDIGSFTAPAADTSAATVNAALSKTASTTAVISGSATTYSYTLTASNKGAAAVIDEIVDTPASGLAYVAGSARWNGAATTEPAYSVADPTKLIFPGPFSLAAGTSSVPTTRTLTYQLKIATCSTGTFSYVNTASAKIGSLIIGSDPASISKTTASGSCGSTSVTVANTTEVIPVEVTTEPASAIGNTAATLNGTIDPNGQSGLPVFIEWGTSASLASFTSVQLAAATTTATTSYPVATSLTGLSTGTVYYYRVRVGSTYGQITSFVTTEPIATPTVTTGSAIGISNPSGNTWVATLVGTVDPNQTAATVYFSWGVDSSGGACTTVAYNTPVRATTDNDGASALLDPVVSAFPVEITNFDVAGSLTANTFYCYRISAVHAGGTVTGLPSSFKTIVVANQTITFAQPSDSTVGSSVTLGATASSSLTVTYVSNTPLVCTVVGNEVTILGGGTCSITASQPGNVSFYAAESVTQSFLVAKQNQEIVFADMAKNYGDADFSAGAVSNKTSTTDATGLPIRYSVDVATCPASVAVVTSGGSIQVVGIGTCVITASQAGDDSWTAATNVSATLTISAKALTVSIGANHKEYDGTDAATLTSPTLVGVLPADVSGVTLGGSATGVFTDATVANGKTVTLSSNFTISGPKSGNYTLSQPGNPTANITRLALNVLVTANNKEYDGTDAATLGSPTLSGVIAGDSANVELVTTGVTAAKFSNANVGNTKAVTLTGSYALSGTASGNYSLVQPSGLTANITAITLTVTGLTGVDKYYDGNTNATYTGGALSGVLTDDTLLVTLVGTPTASFASAGASANPKTITFNGNFSLTGTKAANYLLTQPSSISALISKASQTLTFAGPTGGYVGDTKQPLATASSTLDPTFTVSGDGICTYDAATNTITTNGVGTCTVVASQIGDDNFEAAPNVTRTFEIAAVPVNKLDQTITFNTVIKTYGDVHFAPGASGSSGLPITYSIDVASCPATVATLITGEIHIVGVGTCIVKANQVGSASYNPATEVLGTITINPAVLTIVNIVVDHKVYNASRAATFSGQSLSGRVLSDTSTDVDINAAALPTALFDDENVDNGKSVVFGNFVITGGKSGNYTLTQPGPFTANITKANQTITFVTPDPLDAGASRTLAPTASSNLPVTLTSNTTAKCSVSGLAVTGVAAGDCDLEASQLGNSNYNPASPVVRRMTINAATVITNGGGNGNNGNSGNGNGGGNGNVTPPVTPTPTPSPTVSATPTPVATPRVTPTPRATPRATSTPAPFATVAATPAPRVTPNVIAAPAPTPSATAPAMTSITELLNSVKKAIDKIVTASASPSPSASTNNSTTVQTKLVEQETVTTTKTNGSTTDTLKSANKTIAEASVEKITGFAKGAGIRLEVIGSRIAGQFVVAPGDSADVVAVAKAIEESTARTATAFASINDVTRVTQPAKSEIYNSAVTKTQEQIFEASGLAKPVTLSSLNVTSATKWIQVSAQANTYLPGTMVYLTVTTQPIIFGEAVVDKFGRAQLVGKLPIDVLEQGGHSLRIVGIRSLKGIGTDANGEIVLSQSAMDEIQLFDDGTQATVILSGQADIGGNQTVVREIPLDREIAWWTVWLALIAGLISLVIRVVRPPALPRRRLITAVVALAAGVPAAVLGWTEIAYELWIGVGIALVFGLFNLFWKRGRDKRQS